MAILDDWIENNQVYDKQISLRFVVCSVTASCSTKHHFSLLWSNTGGACVRVWMHMCKHLFSHNVRRETGRSTVCSLSVQRHCSIVMHPLSKTFYVQLISISKYTPFSGIFAFLVEKHDREMVEKQGKRNMGSDVQQRFLAAHEPGAPHQQNYVFYQHHREPFLMIIFTKMQNVHTERISKTGTYFVCFSYSMCSWQRKHC